jgi:2-polyprenyl-3-methyl-5-hydroxy-6-metoxy-1,4-benzoquinol methylase
VVGIDLDDPHLAAEWATRPAPNLTYIAQRAEALPFGAGEFDLACAIEVLEHVPDPDHTLAEMARCAARHVLVSVPREPLWRAVNIARGAYWGQLGNTPGHLNHFSKSAIVALCARHGEVIETRSPFPWTMVLLRV